MSKNNLISNHLIDEKMPDFIDGIDDFQKMRWLHQVDQRKKLADKNNMSKRERRRIIDEWVGDGKNAIKQLNVSFAGIEGILGPHRDKKFYCHELLQKASTITDENISSHHFYSRRLLHAVKPPARTKKVCLIRHWWAVMCEMRRGKNLSELFAGKPPNELRALRIRERGERSWVPIEPATLKDMKEKRAWRRKTMKQLKLIEDTQVLHARIPNCRSMLHMTPAGCPVCGVVHIGGSSNQIQFVKSVNRQSGVITLQKLEFELISLDEERSIELAKIAESQGEIDALESAMFIRSRDTIQAWWPCVLAKWRAQRAVKRMLRSTRCFRIRRLVKMKRAIDATDDNQLDFKYLVMEYPDVRDELEEYLKKVQGRRQEIADRVAKVFLSNLRKAVARARKKEFLRVERIRNEGLQREMALTSKKRELLLMNMRKRVLVLERRKLVCIRPRCCGRRFISTERYETHMGLHKIEDDLRMRKEDSAARRWAENVLLETTCLDRVHQVHSAAVKMVREEGVETEDLDVRLALIEAAIMSDGAPDFAQRSSWTQSELPHLRLSNAELNTSVYHLEIVSLSGEVQTEPKVCLDKALVRIGTLSNLECTVLVTGAVKRDSQVAKVHCMIYPPFAEDDDAGLVVVDNNSRYGTYVVSERTGARRVSTIVTEGTKVVPGDLLCIGVKRNGAAVLSAVDASGACIVYRVRCHEKE